MTFHELLKPEAVKVVAAASSKKRLMHDVAELVQAALWPGPWRCG